MSGSVRPAVVLVKALRRATRLACLAPRRIAAAGDGAWRESRRRERGSRAYPTGLKVGAGSLAIALLAAAADAFNGTHSVLLCF